MSFSRVLLKTVARGALSSRILLARPTLRASYSITVSPNIRSSRILPARPALQASYSASAGLSRDTIQTRILDVLKGFEKVDQSKLNATSSFSKDLGLDSLDAVEVVMAVEEEFGIVIPDREADEIQTVDQAIDYIVKTPEAH